ncbi:MAG: hypothetical protein A2X52_10670 [Candidatus Rokubacteria bacterium GWC2_70_16]|nr:MAG: hypothetical protein A2X52_10670 [Candidatus Rokubacteria bacterium GWC2_70_16]
MSPLIRILPRRLPMRAAGAVSTGTSFATGLPCFVMTIPSGVTRSRSARHCALNFAAGTVFMGELYDWSLFVSTYRARRRRATS